MRAITLTEYYFDKKASDRAIGFIENFITHVKGEWAGQPMVLEKWQKEEIVKPLFGWKRKKDGLRKYRTVYIEIPRKNSKTTMAAFLGLILLLTDGEGGPEIYSAAGDKEQANIVFEIATRMVEQNPSLKQRVEILKKSLFVPRSNGIFRSLTSESRTKFGLNPHGVIVDELHIHKNKDLLDSLDTATGSRRQPLFIIITTAGIREKGNVGWEEHLYATKVKSGAIKDETYLPIIYAADEKKDNQDVSYYFNLKTIKKANPNYGISCKEDYIARKIQKVKNEPINLNTFLRFHLNVWTSSEKSFIPGEVWDKCNKGKVTEEMFYHKDVIGALDLSSKRDFSCFGIINPETFDFLPYFWVPKMNLQNRNYARQIQGWADSGYIELTSGNIIDYGEIETKINELKEKMNLVEIAFDSWNSTHLITDLLESGANMVEFQQGWKTMSPSIKELEQKIMTKQLNHGGNPVMKWMNSNVTLKEDPAGNVKFDKSKSTEKIDGMIVLAMCIGRAVFGGWKELIGGSIYELDEKVKL